MSQSRLRTGSRWRNVALAAGILTMCIAIAGYLGWDSTLPVDAPERDARTAGALSKPANA